jgi:competence protein ComEC
VLRRKGTGFVVDAVKPRGVDRPWSPAVAGAAETVTTLAPPPRAARPVDATPAEADQQMED